MSFRTVFNGAGDPPSEVVKDVLAASAELLPGELIQLDIWGGVELVGAVLSACPTISALKWTHPGRKGNPLDIAPLLGGISSLALEFGFHSALDFASSALELHPGIREVCFPARLMDPVQLHGDLERFFAALGSQVRALDLQLGSIYTCPTFVRLLGAYLKKDFLTRLTIYMNDGYHAFAQLMAVLANCTRLVELELVECNLTKWTVIPKSVTNLKFKKCLLDGSAVPADLGVLIVAECFFGKSGFIWPSLRGVKHLTVSGRLEEASIAQIACVMVNGMQSLTLPYDQCVDKYLVPALKYSTLTTLTFFPESISREDEVSARFCDQVRLLTLLQGQLRRLRSPLQRLPLEMLRLVGWMLL